MALTQVSSAMLNGSTNTTTTIQSNGTTAITIDTSQNVGIGTSSPTSSLVVSGAAQSIPTVNGVHLGTQSGYATMEMVGTSGTGSLIDFTQSGTDYKGRILYDNTSNFFTFATNSSERMRIDSSGNVGIGTSSPGAKLDVNGGVINRAGSGTAAVSWFGDIATATWTTTLGGYNLTFLNDNSTGNLGTGTVSANSTTYYPKVSFTTAGNANFAGSVTASNTCKAWVSCNANTSPTINASFNVSSVVFNSTGNYTVNFTNAFVDTNYCETMGTWEYQRGWTGTYTKTTSSFRFEMHNTSNGSTINMSYINMAFFR